MKTIVVTGSLGCIGSNLCSTLLSAGYDVIGIDCTEAPPDLPYTYIRSDFLDLSSAKPSLRLFNDLDHELSSRHLYALIHNAAYQSTDSFETTPLDQWYSTFQINLFAPVLLTQHLLQRLILARGTVIAIGSIHSSLTKPGFSTYSCSKAALTALVRSLSVELGHSIRFNCIQPAAISTPMLTSGFHSNPELLLKLHQYHPTGSIGQPSDVSSAALFLLDESNMFLNGSIIDVSGGIHSRLHDPF